MSAEMNSTHVEPSGFSPVTGIVSSWRLGYNGETAPIATLFPLQGFILLCAGVVVFIGARTGVREVSTFDPTNTTHIIVAAAIGGKVRILPNKSGRKFDISANHFMLRV